MTAARALFVSNGIGEDLIASNLATALQRAGVAVTAYPLVGLGVYGANVPVLSPRRDLPSGGFSLRAGHRHLAADLGRGLVSLWFEQRATLRRQRGHHDLVIAVGDTYCLWMAALAQPRVVFVATADSIRISPFGRLARWSMRRHARCVFTRDAETADAITRMGLQATSAGTIAMDDLRPAGETFDLPRDAPVVTLLPGSRQDAPDNAVVVAQAARAIADAMEDTRFLLALAPTVPKAILMERLRAVGATAAPTTAGTDHAGELQIGKARLRLTPAFADALVRAEVIIGLAGTANEQAAGLGRPVVAFPGPGSQFGPQFLAAQHRLLGDALIPTADWRSAADAVVRLLRDPRERARRSAIGRDRVGPPGGSHRVTDALLEMLSR
jgi:uncharacterized protein (TIGR03492 family)